MTDFLVSVSIRNANHRAPEKTSSAISVLCSAFAVATALLLALLGASCGSRESRTSDAQTHHRAQGTKQKDK